MQEHDQLLEAISEVKAELKAQGMVMSQVLDQARKTNGRINLLEEWRHTLELKQAKEEGVAEGIGTAAITKGQLRALFGTATAIATLTGTIVGIIVKLM